MKIPHLKVVCVAVLALVILSLAPIAKTQGESQDCQVSFLLPEYPDSPVNYELNVTIPYSLYQHYSIQNHFVFQPDDFAKFVTPYALKPIADRMWQIYNNTENFANGVLALVHQIPYKEIAPAKYPVETLMEDTGDCDLFVYIAASILQAGGVPVVILYYKEECHMEIAVDIGGAPTDARVDVYSVTYQDATYYIGECTGSKWRDGWRIGECPTNYQNVTAQIVGLPHTEQSSIGQVTANLRELGASTVNIQVSAPFTLEQTQIEITGEIDPLTPNENVTLQAQYGDNYWRTITTVQTQPDGTFSYTWTPSTTGNIQVQASWMGNRQLNGAGSNQSSVVVLPLYFVLASLGASAAVVAATAVFMSVRRKRKPAPVEPVGAIEIRRIR